MFGKKKWSMSKILGWAAGVAVVVGGVVYYVRSRES